MISLLSKREEYQRNVMSTHFALDRLEMKERIINVAIGAYRKIKISIIYIFFDTVLIIKSIPPQPYRIWRIPPC